MAIESRRERMGRTFRCRPCSRRQDHRPGARKNRVLLTIPVFHAEESALIMDAAAGSIPVRRPGSCVPGRDLAVYNNDGTKMDPPHPFSTDSTPAESHRGGIVSYSYFNSVGKCVCVFFVLLVV